MLYISIFCIFCRFFCLLTIKIFFPKKNYNHGLLSTCNYNHYVYSDYLVCSVPAIAHIIRYGVFVPLLHL